MESRSVIKASSTRSRLCSHFDPTTMRRHSQLIARMAPVLGVQPTGRHRRRRAQLRAQPQHPGIAEDTRSLEHASRVLRSATPNNQGSQGTTALTRPPGVLSGKNASVSKKHPDSKLGGQDVIGAAAAFEEVQQVVEDLQERESELEARTCLAAFVGIVVSSDASSV